MSNVQQIDLPAYADWLNTIDWTFFCTFTTRYELTLKSARRLMERYHEGLKIYAGECKLFWVAEKYEMKDGFHTHGMLSLPKEMKEPMHFTNMCDLYQLKTGSKPVSNHNGKLDFGSGRNRIDLQKYDKRRNAGKYATKYILKSANSEGGGDYDILV